MNFMPDKLRSLRQINGYSQKKLCEVLTGRCVSDVYSIRGIASIKECSYSEFFLKELSISERILPELLPPDALVGTVGGMGEMKTGIPKGTPVYAGLNDFFASVVGVETENVGQMFDITGTSEHIGLITDSLYPSTPMVSCRYFDKYIYYGITASSGASLDFGRKELDLDLVEKPIFENNPPIFTPYLNGERAPIFDPDAVGMFFGITGKTKKSDMAYSVAEGVVFSLYHIYENMGSPSYDEMRVSGGAAKNALINTLKASLFSTPVITLEENDTSALGAVKIASIASGEVDENTEFNRVVRIVEPDFKIREKLLERYGIYKELYNQTKNSHKPFRRL